MTNLMRKFLTLDNDQLNAQIFNTFITTLYMCMFRAISCSSSGDQTVLTRGCHCSHWASDDGRENARNMLSCKQTSG